MAADSEEWQREFYPRLQSLNFTGAQKGKLKHLLLAMPAWRRRAYLEGNDEEVRAGLEALLTQGSAGGGRQDASANSVAEVPQVEYLRQPMTPIKYRPGSTASSCTYLDAGCQYTLSFWDLQQLAVEVKAFLAASLGGKTVPGMPAVPSAQLSFMNRSESQTNPLFLADVCARINKLYDANGVRLWWALESTAETDHLKPDFRLLRLDGSPEVLNLDVMVGEGKFATVLDDPVLLELATTVQNRLQQDPSQQDPSQQQTRQSYLAAVNQICTYMHVRRLRYGFLTSYNLTFFFKHVGEKQYAMTNGIAHGEKEPSVAAVLYYLSEKSRLDGLLPGPTASSTPVPQVASISGGAQQQGSGQHGQGGAGAGTSRSTPGGGAGSEPPLKAPRLENQLACNMQLQYPEDAGVSCSRGPRVAAEMSEHAPGAGASCSRGDAAGIPEHALVLGARLGWGGGGVVLRGRLYDQEVAVKGADACNSRAVVQCLRHEGTVLAGRMQSLQGVCVPVLHACGYWLGRLTFVLATTIIDGRHPEPGEAESPVVLANAEQALGEIHARGIAHGDIREQNILITHDDKVFFIDFGASVLDPSPQLCATEMQELHSIFAALGSPNSG